jgi:ADP-dependent NAD(P)H-hydrate dehydratase / NAD(P)H-hydrate epimerase
MSVRTRRLRSVLIAIGCFLLSFSIVLAFSYQRLLRRYVLDQAAARGVLIESAVIEAGWEAVRLRDARFALKGVDSISARAELVEVGLRRGKPVRVSVSGLGLEATGAISVVTSQVVAWSQAHTATSDLPVAIDPVNLAWREEPGAAPVLTVLKAVATPEASGGRVIAPKVIVAGFELNKVSVIWKAGQREVAIGIGDDNPVRVQITRDAPFVARITWPASPLAEISAPFGIGGGLPSLKTEGSIELKFADTKSPVDGAVHVVVHGFVPPHPVELNGIVFGDRTTGDAKFSVPSDRSVATLTDVKVVAGAFKLEGGGTVRRDGAVSMKLTGAIPCTSLARSAAVGRLGKLLGGLVGGVAQQRLSGAITVTVTIDADGRDLGAAKVKDSIGGACTVRLL